MTKKYKKLQIDLLKGNLLALKGLYKNPPF